jgi:Rrf2 family protein
MALMSRKVDYALLILAHLHGRPKGACAREIATRYGLNQPFVANILKDLRLKGYVASHRGVKGGYVMQRPADAVSLGELMEALDDPFHLSECTRPDPQAECCFSSVCPVREPVAAVHARIRELLRQTTLAELFRPACPERPELVGLDTSRCGKG